ncbi:MAG: hypothetical protein OHK0039_10040 [Bacteroidia bacterium]
MLLIFAPVQAQEAGGYGEIDPSWLGMETYEPAPDAEAVILLDRCVVSFDIVSRNPVVSYTYLRRIKILDESALKLARVEITYDPRTEDVAYVRGASYGLNARGDVVQFELPKQKLGESRRADGTRAVTFELPLVRVGSVIEYQYVLRTRSFNTLRPWAFQQGLPVWESELHTYIPRVFAYQRIMWGDVAGMEIHTGDFAQPEYLRNAVGELQPGAGGSRLPLAQSAYITQRGEYTYYRMARLPALAREAFSPESNNYIPSVSLRLAENYLTGQENLNLYESWADLSRAQLNRYRPRRLRIDPRVLQVAERNLRQPGSTRDKLQRLYRHIRKTYAWDGTYGLPPRNLAQVQDDRSGNGAALNLLLLYLLREAGFTAYPVLISTQDHGMVQVVVPDLEQFNHLILAVLVEGVETLVDVAGEVDDPGVLPRNDLNELGFLLDDKGGRWVQLRSHNPIVRYAYSRFDLDEQGMLRGEVSVSNRAYGAVIERNELAQYEDDPSYVGYVRDRVLPGMTSGEISGATVETGTIEPEELIVSCDLTTGDFVEVVGDVIIINPMMAQAMSRNPFPQKERSTPVDLTHPLREAHMLGLRIPEAFQVEQLPLPIRVVLPNNAGTFTYNVLQMDNILHFTSTLYLNKTVFLPGEYEGIRTFFDYVVNKHQEDLVLKRRTAQP